jgi:hypothetical protein
MSGEVVQVAPEIGIAYIIEKCMTEFIAHEKRDTELEMCVGGAVRLMRSERMMALRWLMFVERELIRTTKLRRRHMNGKNIGSRSFFYLVRKK